MKRNSRLYSIFLSDKWAANQSALHSAAELCNDGKHFNIEHLYEILDEDIGYFFK